MFLTVIVLAGCTPVQKNGSAGSSPFAQGAQEKLEGTPPEATTGSSLEAMRRGIAPVTPTSAPLKDIFYNFNSYDLRPDARETLKSNATWLMANPTVRIEIEGHCDERGTNEFNLALGALRAKIAKDYLVTLGVSEERLPIISYGEELPVCTEHTEACWQKNRRSRFVIVSSRPAL